MTLYSADLSACWMKKKKTQTEKLKQKALLGNLEDGLSSYASYCFKRSLACG